MADEVLDHVASLAMPGVTVYTLLTIVVPLANQDAFHIGVRADSPNIARQRSVALKYLTGVATELRDSSARVEIRAERHQHAARGILDSANQQNVDMIAMSTHGSGSVSRLLHGSVADKVMRGATIPVLLYRPTRIRAKSVEAPRDHVAARAAPDDTSSAT